jgi:AbrB family looped-hinge helix DNA binding protein
MRKSHSDLIREALTELGEATPRGIMDWVKNHYPGEIVNESSYRSDCIGLASNHTSAHHYPMPDEDRFLLFNEQTKKYRLDPSKTEANANTNIASFASSGPPAANESQADHIDGIPISKVYAAGQIIVPLKIREKLDIKPNDTLAFIVTDRGTVEIRKARLKLELIT